MKNSLILTMPFLIFSIHAEAASLTLKESFQSARMNMESIKRAQASVEQTEEQKIRARAALLPTVAGFASYTKIDPPNAAGNNPFLLTRQYSNGVRLTQPLFRGGSVSGYQLAKENNLLAKYQEDATELNLYQLVIASYYNLAVTQMDVKNVQQLLSFSRERLKEIKERVLIGRSRKGEQAEAEAQLHIAESQFRQTTINLKQAEKNFEFFTRSLPGEIVLEGVPKISGSVDEYVSKIRSRPDILAARQQALVAAKQIDVAKGGHYPQLDLISNYYFERTGILASSKWDAGFILSVPLFQGGGVAAQVREAAQLKRIAELNSSETTRAAERDIVITYQNFMEIQEQIKTLKSALEKSEQAYKLNRKDYQYGLVTNLEVLQSLNIFIETKRSYDSLISIANLNYKSLEAATGVLP